MNSEYQTPHQDPHILVHMPIIPFAEHRLILCWKQADEKIILVSDRVT